MESNAKDKLRVISIIGWLGLATGALALTVPGWSPSAFYFLWVTLSLVLLLLGHNEKD